MPRPARNALAGAVFRVGEAIRQKLVLSHARRNHEDRSARRLRPCRGGVAQWVFGGPSSFGESGASFQQFAPGSPRARPACSRRSARPDGGADGGPALPAPAAPPPLRAADRPRRIGVGRVERKQGRRAVGGSAAIARDARRRAPAQQLLHALDGVAVVIEALADAAQQGHVLRPVIAPAAARASAA